MTIENFCSYDMHRKHQQHICFLCVNVGLGKEEIVYCFLNIYKTISKRISNIIIQNVGTCNDEDE